MNQTTTTEPVPRSPYTSTSKTQSDPMNDNSNSPAALNSSTGSTTNPMTPSQSQPNPHAKQGHTPGPHPVAVLDSPQWLRAFAMQYKGETRASLELCADRLAATPEMLAELRIMPPLLRIMRDAVANRNTPEDLDLVSKITRHAVRIEGLVARATGQGGGE